MLFRSPALYSACSRTCRMTRDSHRASVTTIRNSLSLDQASSIKLRLVVHPSCIRPAKKYQNLPASSRYAASSVTLRSHSHPFRNAGFAALHRLELILWARARSRRSHPYTPCPIPNPAGPSISFPSFPANLLVARRSSRHVAPAAHDRVSLICGL